MDFITGLPKTERDHDAVLVVVDRLSKMVHIEAVRIQITAQEVAYLLQDRIFRYHGPPKDIVSHRDTRFNSNFWRGWARQYGISLSMSTAYHPESDGQTERVNAVFEDTLRHFVGPYQNEWDSWVCMVEFAMNDAWNMSVQNTPFMLNYG
jgi:hypothetical protein